MTPDPRFPWRAVFHRTAAPVFVAGPAGRLRYANPAWEALTGRPLAKVRGMRLSARKSAAPLGQALAPPPDVRAGRPVVVRRPAPDADPGPPWWDILFVPLPGPAGRPLAVVGVVAVVGETLPRGPRPVPAGVAELRREHAAAYPFDMLAGASPAAARVVTQARLAAATTAPVWLVGEPGTGKETLARVVHHNGPGRDRAFVGVECGGVPPFLLDGLLFGRGGLVGSGHLGTVYLRDPAALPRDVQARLARVFTPGTAGGPRLISGATGPAADGVRAGRLVPAFEAELSALEIRLPPLRDRLDDLARFAAHVFARFPGPDGAPPRPADALWPALRAHDWPGNLRELADALGSAAAAAGAEPVGRPHLPRYIQEKHLLATAPPPPPAREWTLDGVLEAVERRLLDVALAAAGGSQTAAADRLGVPRARLWRRLEALGLAAKSRPEPDPKG